MTSTMLSAQLRALASPEMAVVLQRFFKTGPGEYGEGDRFLGIKVPMLRALAKQQDASLATISALLASEFHEERVFALLLLMQFYKHGTVHDKTAAYELYLSRTRHINNWDLVDVSAPHIVGHYLADKPRERLYELAASASLWERRIAIIATFHFIRLHQFDDTLHLAALLCDDRHDLMHKAVGWMLREVGKRDQAVEEAFLLPRYRTLPRTLLRYAIERFPEERRLAYLRGTV
ncbi:MAG: DNA alkylation repair protein [Nitrosomonadales bacterium]|nr:DNA alkylation repair protein [Nitrosomonadales bacterium]